MSDLGHHIQMTGLLADIIIKALPNHGAYPDALPRVILLFRVDRVQPRDSKVP